MSRIIEHTNQQWTGIPVEYIGTVGSYSGTSGGGFASTTYPTSNSLTSSSSDTYSQFTPATGGEGSSRWGFGISGIPDNATINSVTCQIKVACSNASGLSTARAQFFCGNTAKGTALDFTNDSDIAVRTYTNCGTWTREELDSLELRITSQKSGTSTRYVRFYGADLTITYSYNEIQYEITTSSQSESATISPLSQYVTEGESGVVTFSNISDITEVNVKDNNTSVTLDLVNTSGTTYTYTIEDISSDHNITIQDVPSVYVTIVNNSSKLSNIVPSSGTSLKVGQGSNIDVKIYTNEIDHISIYDNDIKNNNVSIEREIDSGSITCIPGSHSDNTFKTFTSQSNGFSGTTSTSRATLQLGSKNSTQYVYYNFDVSSIPSSATILSVSCSFKICVSNSFSSTDTGVELFSGTVSKSDRNYRDWYTNTTADTYSLMNIGEFTRDELDNVRLKITGRTGTAGRSIYFYGADLVVAYTYEADVYYLYTSFAITTKTIRIEDKPIFSLTASSTYQDATISPVSTSVYEGESCTFTISTSDLSQIALLDNGVNVTSQITNNNGVYQYIIQNISEIHTLIVQEYSQSHFYLKQDGSFVLVDRIYKKVNGVWTEMSDPSSIIDTTKIYIYKNS